MNCHKPGGSQLTEHLIKLCDFHPGHRILDLGCGLGDSMVLCRDKFSLIVTGCDSDNSVIELALNRYPNLQIRKTDGLSLDFPSRYFDGVIIECAFSLMDRHQELLHELFCILKPGAPIAITDLYLRNPDPVAVKLQHDAALALLNKPRVHEDCSSDDDFPSPYIFNGVFVLDYLLPALENAGFTDIYLEDRTQDLRDYVAQVLMDFGSFAAMREQTLPNASICGLDESRYSKDTGYFLLTARKGASL